jgi:hypothetical protein
MVSSDRAFKFVVLPILAVGGKEKGPDVVCGTSGPSKKRPFDERFCYFASSIVLKL